MIKKPPMKDPGRQSPHRINYFFHMFTLSRDIAFLPTVVWQFDFGGPSSLPS
jgi:hypothetical protein